MPKNISQDIDQILADSAVADQADSSVPELASEVDSIAANIEKTRKYDSPLKAAAAGFARGATLGLSDVAATKTGLVKPETLKGLQEVNPVVSTGTEIAGNIAGLVAGEGPVALASRVGRATEEALIAKAALTAAEKSMARRIAEKGAAAAAAGAVEGSIYGAGQLLSEESLGDAEFNAQNLISAVGTGAVLGGLVGGAFGTSFGAADELGSAFTKTGKLKRAAVRELDEQSNAIDLLAPHGADKVKLEKMAAEVLPGDQPVNFADYVRDDLKLELATSRADLYKANKLVNEKAAQDIRSVIDAIDRGDNNGIKASYFKNKLIESVENKLSSEFKNPKKFEEAISKIKKEIEKDFYTGELSKSELAANKLAKNMEQSIKNSAPQGLIMDSAKQIIPKKERLTPSKIYEFMQRMGKKAFDSSLTDLEKAAYTRTWGATKDIIRDYVEKSGDDQLAKIWADANHKFKLSKILDKPLATRMANDAPIGSFKDAILGTAGAVIGGPVAAVGAVTAKKFLDSDLKRKLVVLGSVERAATNNVKRIAEATKNFFTSSAKAVRKSSVPLISTIFHESGLSQDFTKPRSPQAPKNDKQAFKNMQKNISTYMSDPEKFSKRIAAATQKMDMIAPNTAQASRETLVRAVEFLDMKMPKDRNQPFDLFQSQREYDPSSQVMAKFKRYVQVVEDPYSVLNDLEAGTATQEHIEALRIVYPAVYNKIRTEMLDYVIKNPTELDFNKKTQLGILLDAAVTPALRGKSVANLQSTFISKDEGGQETAVPTTVGGLSKLKIAENESTSIEKIQTGNLS